MIYEARTKKISARMSSSIPNLYALLIDELEDIYDAENQLLEALPKMAEAANHPELKEALTSHLGQTRTHVQRLNQMMSVLGLSAKGKTCQAMTGLLKEGREALEINGPAAVRDAALIGAAQRVEHYEIAAYGTARTFADLLGELDVANLLQTTLDEESATNRFLTEIAVSVNTNALTASG